MLLINCRINSRYVSCEEPRFYRVCMVCACVSVMADGAAGDKRLMDPYHTANQRSRSNCSRAEVKTC